MLVFVQESLNFTFLALDTEFAAVACEAVGWKLGTDRKMLLVGLPR